MPSNRQSNPNRQIAAIHRVIDSRLKPNMTLARVVSVPPHGNTALIRMGGSATLESAEVLGDLKLQPNDTVIIIRPEQSAGWFILSAYTKARSGLAPRVPSGAAKLAAPGNVTLTSGVGFNLLTWETPPNHPDLSYQVEVGDAPAESESNVIYQVRGSVFLDVLAPGTTQSYRVLCVDNTWNKSGWSDWETESAGGGVLVGTEAAIPTAPVGIYFATDTDTLYIGDGTAWNAITGGGSSGAFDPDLVPASPSAYDDEFDDQSIDGKWTEYDPNATTTITEQPGEYLTVSVQAGAADRWGGLYQSVDLSGDFTIAVKMKRGQNQHGCAGIALYEDPTDTEAIIYVYGLYESASLQTIGVHTTEGVGFGGGTAWEVGVDYYVRVRYDASENILAYDISSDGLNWSNGGSGELAFVPTAFGPLAARSDESDLLGSTFYFIRFRNGFDSMSDPVYGDGILGGITDHGDLDGLADDDHTQYHNNTRGDARYYQKTEFINTSAGISDAGKPVVLDAGGLIDDTMLPAPGASALDDLSDVDLTTPPTDGQSLVYNELLDLWIAGTVSAAASGSGVGVTDHGELDGLLDDDHTQYHNDTRGDARYSQLGHTHSAPALEDLSDVDLTTPPTDGQALVYNELLEAWVAGTVTAQASGSGVETLERIKLNEVVLTSDQASISLDIPTGYDYFELVGSAYTNRTGSWTDFLRVRANGDDTDTNYIFAQSVGGGNVVNSTGNNPALCRIPADPHPLAGLAHFRAELHHFHNSSRHAQALVHSTGLYNNTTTAEVNFSSWAWRDTSDVTSLLLYPSIGTAFKAGTNVTLYGYKYLTGSGSSSTPATSVHQVVFTVVGDVEVAAHPILIPNLTGASKTISSVGLVARTGPTGADLIVNVKVGGTSIWNSSASYAKITDGQTSGETSTIDNPTWGTGAANALEVEVTQIGSTTPGADLAIVVVYS